MIVRSAALACLLLLTSPGMSQAGWGSGTVVGIRGEILTAAHVVHGCNTIQIVLPNGRLETARVEGLDPIGDLALLRIAMIGGAPPRIREDLVPGESVHVFGFPKVAEGHSVLSTSRVASLTGPRGERDAITVDGRISVGESGAGVFDSHGNLVGVAYSVSDRRWYAVGAARISEFLLAHGVPISFGATTEQPSLTRIANYLRTISVNIRCWSSNLTSSSPFRRAR